MPRLQYQSSDILDVHTKTRNAVLQDGAFQENTPLPIQEFQLDTTPAILVYELDGNAT